MSRSVFTIAVAYSDGTVVRVASVTNSNPPFITGHLQDEDFVRFKSLVRALLDESVGARSYATWRPQDSSLTGCYFIQAGKASTRMSVSIISGDSDPTDKIPEPLVAIANVLLRSKLIDSSNWSPALRELYFAGSIIPDTADDESTSSRANASLEWPSNWQITDSYSNLRESTMVYCTELPVDEAQRAIEQIQPGSGWGKTVNLGGKQFRFFTSRYVFPDDHKWKNACSPF